MPVDSFDLPDAFLLFYDVVLVFDNVKHRVFIVSNAYLPDADRSDQTLQREYDTQPGKLTAFSSFFKNLYARTCSLR
jgi:anthranilate/para-aminobenzoate synthase component I